VLTIKFNQYVNSELQDPAAKVRIPHLYNLIFLQLCCASVSDNCGSNCLTYNENYLGWDEGGIGRMLVFMAIQGFVFFLLVFFFDSPTFKHFRQFTAGCQRLSHRSVHPENENLSDGKSIEDSDVSTERQRVADSQLETLIINNSLVLRELSKTYDSFVAVKGLSVAVPFGECFGLLGINGAGKTTTFKMLTGDITLGGDSAYVNGYSVRNNLGMVHRSLGYCPQFDALIDHLTGREMLVMFARLRGIQEQLIKNEVNFLLDALLLTASRT
jgi:ATP-binding cassette subfamily A (ABC1) protein 3